METITRYYRRRLFELALDACGFSSSHFFPEACLAECTAYDDYEEIPESDSFDNFLRMCEGGEED